MEAAQGLETGDRADTMKQGQLPPRPSHMPAILTTGTEDSMFFDSHQRMRQGGSMALGEVNECDDIAWPSPGENYFHKIRQHSASYDLIMVLEIVQDD